MTRMMVRAIGVLAVAWGGAAGLPAWGQRAVPNVASDGGPVQPEAKGVAAAFQEELKVLGSGAVVEGCTAVVDVKPGSPGGPAAHGGVCAVRIQGKPVRLMMCNTEGVGGFALATSFTATEDAVREFVLRACPRG